MSCNLQLVIEFNIYLKDIYITTECAKFGDRL